MNALGRSLLIAVPVVTIAGSLYVSMTAPQHGAPSGKTTSVNVSAQQRCAPQGKKPPSSVLLRAGDCRVCCSGMGCDPKGVCL